MSKNARINALPQIETAIRILESFGYEIQPLWTEHHAWLQHYDTRTPTDHDSTWATRNAAPASIEAHFVQVLKHPIYGDDPSNGPIGWEEEKQYGPVLFSAADCFTDRQFTLTGGMRDVLRQAHGLTPTKVVVVTNAVVFPGTNILSQFTIKSALHVDPKQRRHVLIEAVISPAAKFFEQASRLDKAREEEKVKAERKGPTEHIAKALEYY